MLLFILYPSVAGPPRPRAAWFSRYRVSIKFQCAFSPGSPGQRTARGARRMNLCDGCEQRRPQSSHETCTQTNKLALFTVSDILIPVHHLGPSRAYPYPHTPRQGSGAGCGPIPPGHHPPPHVLNPDSRNLRRRHNRTKLHESRTLQLGGGMAHGTVTARVHVDNANRQSGRAPEEPP